MTKLLLTRWVRTIRDRWASLMRARWLKVLGTVLARSIGYLVLILLAVTMIVPFIMMISDSLKTEMQFAAIPRIWVPIPPRWQNYAFVLTTAHFGLYALNSIKLGVLSGLGAVLGCAWAGYGFARINFKGRDQLFMAVLMAIMLPGTCTMIPVFILNTRLGWVNSHYPLWVPALFGNPFGIFLTRQFFRTMPQELEDAAKIDGCNDYGVFWRIMLPLAGPTLATLGLFSFMGSWNDLLGPVLYLYRDELYTLPIGLTKFRGFQVQHWGHSMAGATLTLLPLMGLFLFTQRFFVRGVVMTGMK